MEARPCQIIDFFNGTKQMLIPLFQRSYEWKEREWTTLWDDILERYERHDEPSGMSHFTGAIVTAPARSNPAGVSKFLVIDGQQRLTTAAILLCAIRSLLEPDSKPYRKITRFLVNEDDDGLDHFKILPTQMDRGHFRALLESRTDVEESGFQSAFSFFRKKLQGNDSDDQPIDVHRFLEVMQSRVHVVSIVLAENDDPYLIFESLNAKGAPLTQADLIRNYLLLRIHLREQQAIYDAHWIPLQARLGNSLPEFFRQYLIMERGEDVPKGEVYAVLKKQIIDFDDKQIPGFIAQLTQYSLFYKDIIDEPSSNTPRPILDRLARIRRWEITTSHPLLLKLFGLYHGGTLPAEQLETCLEVIESFAVRRTICRVPTNQLKRIFINLTKTLDTTRPLESLTESLAAGQVGRRWPRDDEFEREWLTYRAYSNPRDRCSFILESLEQMHPHKERASFANATIEHVLPQTMSSEWQDALGPTASIQHEEWVHTIGNLTLTGYNSELSNSPFPEKKRLLADSHFELNCYFKDLHTWDATAIEARARALFALARKLWPRPDA